MDEISLRCPAKINLSLDVVGIREDGYHLLKMVMQSIGLYDYLKITKNNEAIRVNSNSPKVPADMRNICYKAAKLVYDKYSISGGIDIYINKNIPVAAGLAGGSTDAAGVIEAMNELYGLRMTLEEKMELGVNAGADVPFCLMKGTALAEGIGEILTPLEPLDFWCVIARPDKEVSTAEIFKEIKLDEISKHPETEKLCDYVNKKQYLHIANHMVNVLERVTIKTCPAIFEIKNIMSDFHAIGTLMSGSGPTVFGIFEDRSKAEVCYNRLRDYISDVYLVKTVSS